METIERPGLEALFKDINGLCDRMTDEDCHRVRDILEHLTNRWALWSMSELARAGAPLRFSELQRRMEGVTQKVLTQTLRMLESNGLVRRTVYAEVPPRVDYVLTDIGKDLLAETLPLWIWVARRLPAFERQSV
jgi:DNA-binding HxlR family transcriptional regulator